MTDAIPQRGLTSEPMRLTYPAQFRSKAHAERFARENHLAQAGVVAAQIEDSWRLVIDSDRVPMLTSWLRQQYPGILWAVSWTPQAEKIEAHA